MDHLQQLRHRIRLYLILLLLLANGLAVGLYWLFGPIAAAAGGVAVTILIAVYFTKFVTSPIKILWQAILHLSPTDHGVAAPQPETLSLGRELVTSLIAQVRQLTSVAQTAASESEKQIHDLYRNFIAQNLPLPLLVIDASETIIFANGHAAEYAGMAAEDMLGKNVYMVLDMSFPSEATFDSWLKDAKISKATAVASWERVRLNVRDNHPMRLFDLAAYYNRDNPDHYETMLVMFDHTKEYSQDDQAVSFIALSVHELRTPLTLLRGYIEVFEEELAGKMTPELESFMLKMRAMSVQLTAFVNNILNVARVDDDQLELKLNSENWETVLQESIDMINLQAKIRGITLKCQVAPNLPEVGIDRLSIREVINNLIDNAIKYSGSSKEIIIDAHLNKEGLVETTVQDFGVGIPTSIMSNLFTKFYRDHRNRAQIGGTGLGLYLSKAIVTAHGGNLWVQSKEGQGSTFGFTIVPYAQLAAAQKQTGDQAITRSAHGWIKNHSLYRR